MTLFTVEMKANIGRVGFELYSHFLSGKAVLQTGIILAGLSGVFTYSFVSST